MADDPRGPVTDEEIDRLARECGWSLHYPEFAERLRTLIRAAMRMENEQIATEYEKAGQHLHAASIRARWPKP